MRRVGCGGSRGSGAAGREGSAAPPTRTIRPVGSDPSHPTRPFNNLTTSPPLRIHAVPLVLPNRRLTPWPEPFTDKQLSGLSGRISIRHAICEVADVLPHGSRAPGADGPAVTCRDVDGHQPPSSDPRVPAERPEPRRLRRLGPARRHVLPATGHADLTARRRTGGRPLARPMGGLAARRATGRPSGAAPSTGRARRPGSGGLRPSRHPLMTSQRGPALLRPIRGSGAARHLTRLAPRPRAAGTGAR